MSSKRVFHFTKVMRVEPLLRGSITKDLSHMDWTGLIKIKIIAIFLAFIVSVQNTKAEEARHFIIYPAGSTLNFSGGGGGAQMIRGGLEGRSGRKKII